MRAYYYVAGHHFRSDVLSGPLGCPIKNIDLFYIWLLTITTWCSCSAHIMQLCCDFWSTTKKNISSNVNSYFLNKHNYTQAFNLNAYICKPLSHFSPPLFQNLGSNMSQFHINIIQMLFSDLNTSLTDYFQLLPPWCPS